MFSRPFLIRSIIVLAALLIALVLIMLADRRPQSLLSTTARPTPLFAIVGPGRGDDPLLVRPLAAAFSPSGQIYVSDTGNRRICVFTDKGAFVREFGRAKRDDGGYDSYLQQPAGLAVRADGRVYVADVRGGALVLIDARGAVIKRVTSADPGTAGAWTPTDVALSGDRVYVTDGRGIAVLTSDGDFIRRVDKAQPGTPFSHPNGIAVRDDGTMVVADTNNARIVAMKKDGSLLWVAGPDSGKQRVVGLPRGLAVAGNGDVLVSDAFLFAVVRVSATGVYKDTYGKRGGAMGELSFPNDVDVRGDVIAITDKENNRVQVVKFPGL